MKLEPTQNYQLNVVYRMDGGSDGIHTLSFNVSAGVVDYVLIQHETDRTIQAHTVSGAVVSLLVDRIIYLEAFPVE
jgi:hypothetical protein